MGFCKDFMWFLYHMGFGGGLGLRFRGLKDERNGEPTEINWNLGLTEQYRCDG